MPNTSGNDWFGGKQSVECEVSSELGRYDASKDSCEQKMSGSTDVAGKSVSSA